MLKHRAAAGRLLLIGLLIALVAWPAAAQTTVRVSGWGGTDIAIVEELLERFVQPAVEPHGIRVVYEPIADAYDTYLINALSAGTAPDLFYVDIFWAESLMRTGQLAPLNDYLAASSVLGADDIIPELLAAFTLDGKIYGIPKDFNTLALFFNKDLFDFAGVPYPDESDDWNSLADKLRRVAAISPDVYGLALAPEFARMGAFAYATGWRPFDENGHTDVLDPRFVEAFKWYTGLAADGSGVHPQDVGQGWGGGAMATEQVAAAVEGAWILGFLRDEAPNMEYDAVPLPRRSRHGSAGQLDLHRRVVDQLGLRGARRSVPRAGGADQPRGAAVGAGAGPRPAQPGGSHRQPVLRSARPGSTGQPGGVPGSFRRVCASVQVPRVRRRLDGAHQRCPERGVAGRAGRRHGAG